MDTDCKESLEDSVKTAAAKFLQENECCSTCNYLILSYDNVQIEYLVEQVADDNGSSAEVDTGGNTMPLFKRKKTSPCIICIEMLRPDFMDDAASVIIKAMDENKFDSCNFSLNLSIPVSIYSRCFTLCTHLENKFPSLNLKEKLEYVNRIKETWKVKVGKIIEQETGVEYTNAKQSLLAINVNYSYSHEDIEQTLMAPILMCQRRGQSKSYNKMTVIDLLKRMSQEKITSVFPTISDIPCGYLILDAVKMESLSLYLAGRYLKYNRDLPQTPWFVDGEKKKETSVQEIMTYFINKKIQAKSVKFSSSGREDVDVRCLGRGRPFVLEFLSPRCTAIDSVVAQNLQNIINANNQSIKIRDLQVVSKKLVASKLKEGESDKKKTYCALCIIRGDVNLDAVQKLNTYKDFYIDQHTPLRVLHRRTQASRKRKIFFMKAEHVKDIFFKLTVETDAGTYIKEFIHGDLGRTVPSIYSLLGVKVDILALDVMNVALNWPPSLQ